MTNLAAQRLGLVAARSAVEALQLERLQAAAARTGLSDHQLRGLIRSGRLPAYHLGRWYLLDVRVLDALLKECVAIPGVYRPRWAETTGTDVHRPANGATRTKTRKKRA